MMVELTLYGTTEQAWFNTLTVQSVQVGAGQLGCWVSDGVRSVRVAESADAVAAILNAGAPEPSVVTANYYTPLLEVEFDLPTATCANPTEPWKYVSVYSVLDGMQTVTVSGRLVIEPNQLVASPISIGVRWHPPLLPGTGFAYPTQACGFINADNQQTQSTARAMQEGGMVQAVVSVDSWIGGKVLIEDNTQMVAFVEFTYQFTP